MRKRQAGTLECAWIARLVEVAAARTIAARRVGSTDITSAKDCASAVDKKARITARLAPWVVLFELQAKRWLATTYAARLVTELAAHAVIATAAIHKTTVIGRDGAQRVAARVLADTVEASLYAATANAWRARSAPVFAWDIDAVLPWHRGCCEVTGLVRVATAFLCVRVAAC